MSDLSESLISDKSELIKYFNHKKEEKICRLHINSVFINEMEKIEFNVLIRKIITRKCFKEIYQDIIDKIKMCQRNGSIIGYIPQICFLIYGNKNIGKTALCYYLSFMFKVNTKFDLYDIIIVDEESSDKNYVIRFSGNDKFVERKMLPEKNNPTIIISDNVEIHEDDYSEDNIIIMISSPDIEKYKIFRNKRQPIQYWITQIKENELLYISLLFAKSKLYDEAEMLGGNIINASNYRAKRNMSSILIDKKNKETADLCNFIPGKYNENCYIYDTDEFNKIPTHLRFMSDEIADYVLTKDYSDDIHFKLLFDAYQLTENGRIYEKLVHIYLKKVELEIKKDRNINCEKGRIFKEKENLEHILTSNDNSNNDGIDLNNQCYVNLSRIETFPGADGLLIGVSAICALQMTISSTHPTKCNIIMLLTVYYCIVL